MKKILILGAGGFVGIELSSYFRMFTGYEIINADVKPNSGMIECNIFDRENLKELLLSIRPDHVIFLIGSAKTKSKLESHKINCKSAEAFYSIMEELGLSKKTTCTFFSSAAVYGNPARVPVKENDEKRPLTIYGKDKYKMETYLIDKIEQGDYINIIRPFNIIGVKQNTEYVIPNMIKKVKDLDATNNTIELFNLDSVRDFIAIDDICRLIKIIVDQEIKNEVLNVGSGQATSIRDVFEMIKNSMKIEQINIRRNITEETVPEIYADITRAKGLGWCPKETVNETIKKIVRLQKSTI